MNITGKILFIVPVLSIAFSIVKAQNAVAISSNPGPGLHVALNWSPHSTGVRYNIFRKNETDTDYPNTALNRTPIQLLTICTSIKSLLITARDSSDWKMLSKALSGPGLFNPCTIDTIYRSPEKYKRLLVLSKSSMPVAIVAGLGYKDNTVTNGNVYYYKIVALKASGAEVGTVATNLKVTAGSFTLLPAPTAIVAEAGDAIVQVRWNDVPGAAGYSVERASTAAGVFARINESQFSAEFKNHLNGDTLIPSSNGLLDFKRYATTSGKDSTHLVKGITIDGPKNSTNYYYRVKTLDLFQRAGNPSAIFGPIMPMDSTEPSVPNDIMTTTDDTKGHVSIRWTQVVKDKNGHWEYPDSRVRYKIYRFATSEDPNENPSTYLREVTTIRGLKSREITDSNPDLRSLYGNKTWWYRIRAIDNSGNISQWSTAVSAVVKDVTAPGIVKNLVTKGFEDYITVKWKPSTEPDIGSYVIYRSLCHLGSWLNCNGKDTCKIWSSYDPMTRANEMNGTQKTKEKEEGTSGNPAMPCPCSGPFVFLGEITKASVDRALAAGNAFFEDRTIPAGSPLCYAYWIKAKDSSDNLSGSSPLPSSAERTQIRCERLRDLTAPEPAILSGLYAQAEQIKVEWVGPPTQDTRAYHVYRAQGINPAVEPPTSAYSWAGGMTVELPPTMPVVLSRPYRPASMATCDRISVQATPWMSQGFFEDKATRPKLTYWYKVVGIDYDGNESKLEKAAAISTFSFSRKVPDAPVIDLITKQADPCGVNLKWTPFFEPSKQIGFMVYRSSTAEGSFIPIVVSPVKGNSFTDINVVKGQVYWYRIAILMANGRLSALSAPKNLIP